MASVNLVYNTLKDLANKEQRGFITPAVFDNFAQLAQLNVFKNILDKVQKGKALRARGIDGARHQSVVTQAQTDLSALSKTSVLSQADGVFAKPEEMAYLIGLTTNGSVILGQSTRTPIEILYDEDKIDYILKSDLMAPTEEHPIGLVSEQIEVFPSSIKKIRITYYKYPQGLNALTGARTASVPTFGYTTSSGVEIYNPTNSVDFELPDHYVPELVSEMAKLVGINLRDSDVFAYAQAEQQTRK